MHVRDPDEVLIEELLRPPPLEEARASLEFWQRRRKALRVHRMRARREAKEMIRVAREQVAAAERARYGSGLAGLARRILAGEPFPWGLDRRLSVAAFAWRVGSRRIVDAVAVCVLLIGVVLLALRLF
jgi:hypothetical protein